MRQKIVHFSNSAKETAYEYFKLQHLIKKVKSFHPKQDQLKYNDMMEQLVLYVFINPKAVGKFRIMQP